MRPSVYQSADASVYHADDVPAPFVYPLHTAGGVVRTGSADAASIDTPYANQLPRDKLPIQVPESILAEYIWIDPIDGAIHLLKDIVLTTQYRIVVEGEHTIAINGKELGLNCLTDEMGDIVHPKPKRVPYSQRASTHKIKHKLGKRPC